ncbi:TAXI family TRAP transporter solute-binding subunit [Shumkonia mesophila]|uniref:TAXI family TRAP transporter solute-binding subunit n=1 Tax=Shumkonia mesophila TaxID=2838854 RepID=UPI0029346C91|nr:TAXI family TRAP transporter solute-binding subunit [Shumkonia mesophila]
MQIFSKFTVAGVTALFGAMVLAVGTADAAEKQFLSWGSSSTGTSQYVYVGMLAGLARQYLPDISFNNEAVSGTSENLDLIRRDKIALAIASPERLYAAHHGVGKYKEKIDVTTMWVMNPQVTLMFTKKNSGIESFRDLAGKTVNIGPAGSSNEIKNSFILESYGYARTKPGAFEFKELKLTKLSHSEAANALAEGTVDAAIATQPLPDPSYAELAVRMPIQIIGVDENMFEKVRTVYPWMWVTNVPTGFYRGQEQPIKTLGDRNYIIASGKNLSEDAAYRLTKIYVEKLLPEMAKQTDYLKPYAEDPKELVKTWVIPGHPGAVRYFKEVGLNPEVVR